MARPKKIRMAKITWLGEDDLHEEGNGPRKNTWRGIEFVKGEPVEVSDPSMIEKAKTNPFYKVEDGSETTAEVEPESE